MHRWSQVTPEKEPFNPAKGVAAYRLGSTVLHSLRGLLHIPSQTRQPLILALDSRGVSPCSLRTLPGTDGQVVHSQEHAFARDGTSQFPMLPLADAGPCVLRCCCVSRTEQTYLLCLSLFCPPPGPTLLKISLCSAMDLSCIDFSAFVDLGSGSTPLKTFL